MAVYALRSALERVDTGLRDGGMNRTGVRPPYVVDLLQDCGELREALGGVHSLPSEGFS
jgi:hypothetical protein